MAETSLTTDGFLETTYMDPLHEDSPMETGDISKEEEPALLWETPVKTESENEISYAQVNQERAKKTNKQLIEQATCTSSNIKQKQPQGQETSPRRAWKVIFCILVQFLDSQS